MILDEKIRKKLIEVQSGDTDITFSELKDKYLEIAKDQLAYNTYYRKKSTLDKISKEWGKNIIARKVTPQFINKYLDNMIYGENYANETVNSYKSCIGVCYELGIKYGYLTKNPIDKVKVSWKSDSLKKREEIENKYLEDSEFEKIMLDCDNQKRPDLKDFFYWMYLTGMRCGEAAAIQKKMESYEEDKAKDAEKNDKIVQALTGVQKGQAQTTAVLAQLVPMVQQLSKSVNTPDKPNEADETKKEEGAE